MGSHLVCRNHCIRYIPYLGRQAIGLCAIGVAYGVSTLVGRRDTAGSAPKPTTPPQRFWISARLALRITDEMRSPATVARSGRPPLSI
jgi:hypothetical protein